MEARKLFSEVVDGFERNDLLTYASAISFQILTAIVPFLLFVLGLIGFLELDAVWAKDLAPEVRPRVSKEVFSVLDDTVTQVVEKQQAFWLTAGFALALWQVSGAVRAVMGALDGVYGSRTHRPARQRYPLSLWLSVAVGFLIVAAFCTVRFIPLLVGDVGWVLGALLFLLRWLVAAGLLAFAVGLLVHYAPGVSRPLPWVSFGTLLVIGGWVAMSIGFWLYLTRIADYESVFGHLATVIVLMAYLYALATVFLAGAQIDASVRLEMKRKQRA
jgi:membrane protein